jgi:hypothetical protein
MKRITVRLSKSQQRGVAKAPDRKAAYVSVLRHQLLGHQYSKSEVENIIASAEANDRTYASIMKAAPVISLAVPETEPVVAGFQRVKPSNFTKASFGRNP